MRCAVSGCGIDNKTNNFSSDIKFFSFPKDKKLQENWKHFCKRTKNFNVKTARICSKHFSSKDYERNLQQELLGYTPKNYRPLKKDAVPSKHSSLPSKLRKPKENNTSRSEGCSKNRKKIELIETVLEVVRISDGVDDPLNVTLANVSTRDIGVNTEVVVEVDHRDRLIAELQEKIKILEHIQDIMGKVFSKQQIQKFEGSKARLKRPAILKSKQK